MALKLMYITNRSDVAHVAESAGVDRIFVDMEYIGKADRQGGMDTVQNHHTVDDVRKIKNTVTTAQVMVRINPIHAATEDYCSSKEEIDAVIEAGADIVMLPFFKTIEEVREFIDLVDGRVKTLPLVETPEAVANIDKILILPGLDEIFIGLNDLSLGYGKKFMFELLSDGTVERLCSKFKQKGFNYGFGGIGRPGYGTLPAEYIIREHYHLGSTCTILSRSFCNVNRMEKIDKIEEIFREGIMDIRNLEAECKVANENYFTENVKEIKRRVKIISEA